MDKREQIACLHCGRRTRTNCGLVIKDFSSHWCNEAMKFADQILSLNTVDVCPECNGEGRRPLSMGGMIHDCPECGGSGIKDKETFAKELNSSKNEVSQKIPTNNLSPMACPTCKGTGKSPPVKLNLLTPEEIDRIQDGPVDVDDIDVWVIAKAYQIKTAKAQLDKIKRDNPDYTFEEA